MKSKFIHLLLASIFFMPLIYSCTGDKDAQKYNNATLKFVEYSPEHGIIYDKNDKFLTTYKKEDHTIYLKGTILWNGDNKGLLYYNDSIICGSYSKYLHKDGVIYIKSNLNGRGVWLITENLGMAVAAETNPSREAIDSLDFDIQTCNDPNVIIQAVDANHGNINAMYKMGQLYEYGNSYIRINQNPEKALFWYEKAGQAGYDEAYLRLGNKYLIGSNGFPKDENKAINYYKLAADLGNDEAARTYELFSKTSSNTPSDNNRERQEATENATPYSIVQKIRGGYTLGGSDFEVMIRYCQKHNEDATAIIDDIVGGNCKQMEIDMMMNTLHNRYPYIELFLDALGNNRERMTQEQKDKCTDIANELKMQYSRLKNR